MVPSLLNTWYWPCVQCHPHRNRIHLWLIFHTFQESTTNSDLTLEGLNIQYDSNILLNVFTILHHSADNNVNCIISRAFTREFQKDIKMFKWVILCPGQIVAIVAGKYL